MNGRDRSSQAFRRPASVLTLAAALGMASIGMAATQRMMQQGEDNGASGGDQSMLEASFVAGDFDADGLIDQAAVAADGTAIQILYGEPDGAFSAPVAVAAGVRPVRLQMADLNGDLADDLAVFSARGALHVLLGRPGRAFDPFGPLGGAPAPSGAIGGTVVQGHPSCLAPPFDPRPHGSWSFTIDPGGAEVRDGALLWWATDCETDLLGFNVVRLLFHGGTPERIQLNAGSIPCQGCTDGLGYGYTYLLAPHRGIHNLFVEAIIGDGSARYLGPGVISMRPFPGP